MLDPCPHCEREFKEKTNEYGRNLHIMTCEKNPDRVDLNNSKKKKDDIIKTGEAPQEKEVITVADDTGNEANDIFQCDKCKTQFKIDPGDKCPVCGE